MGQDKVIWECDPSKCNFYEVLHGMGEYREGQMAKCARCTRVSRAEMYRTFIEKRGDQDGNCKLDSGK